MSLKNCIFSRFFGLVFVCVAWTPDSRPFAISESTIMFKIPAPAAVNLELLYLFLYLSTQRTVANAVGTVD